MYYNREAAVNYAEKWALYRNPMYYDFSLIGGDCTNFISQCLYSGNIPMNRNKNGWFYQSLESRSPSWSGVEEFWSFAISNKTEFGVKIKEILLSELEIGDIIQLGNDSGYYHTLLVTKLISPTPNNIFICAHDYDSLNRKLSSYNYQKIRCGKIIA